MIDISRPVYENDRLTGYYDHRKSNRIYLLPTGLEIAQLQDRSPLFSLFTYAGQHKAGSFLSIGFDLSFPFEELLTNSKYEDSDLSSIPVDQAYLRLLIRTPDPDVNTEPEAVKWYKIDSDSGRLSSFNISLSKNEALLLESLLKGSGSNVETICAEIRVVFKVRGECLPLLFTFNPAIFHLYLKERINMQDRPTETESSLPVNSALAYIKEWLTEHIDTAVPLNDKVRPEDALEILTTRLFNYSFATTDKYNCVLKRYDNTTESSSSTDDNDITLDLRVPADHPMEWYGTWDFSTFWDSLSEKDQEKLFTRSPLPEALRPVPLHISNNLQLDAHLFRKVVATVHYSGETLNWETKEISFDNSEDFYKTLWSVVPHGEEFRYFIGLKAYFHSGEDSAWPPAPIKLAMTASKENYFSLNPGLFGLGLFNISIHEDALDNLGKVEVQLAQLASDTLNNSNSEPEVHSVFISSSICRLQKIITRNNSRLFRSWRLRLHSAESEDLTINGKWQNIENDRLLITAWHTQVTEPVMINLKMNLSASWKPEFILIRLKRDDNRVDLIKLDSETREANWAYWKDNIFETISYQWDAEIYFRRDDHLITSHIQWKESSSEELIFSADTP